jgi:radical SAM protein with 4Fe4S-binding SPASM domain
MTCFGDQLGMEFSAAEIREAKARNGLLSLELELSRVCNLRCLYCYAGSGTPLPNELSLPELQGVVDQAADLGAKKIIILGGGEPLLYPDLLVLIAYIRARGIAVDLFTNGQTLDLMAAKQLYGLGCGVVLKMNSRTPEVQDQLAGKTGASAAIERALAALRRAGYPDENHRLGIETIICRPNYAELPELWRWARVENIVPYVEVMTKQGRAVANPGLDVGSAEVKALFERLSQIDRDEFLCSWQPHPPLVASQCGRHEYSCTVTSVGDVHPCPGVDLSVGNIRHKGLREILNESDVIRDLRGIRQNIKGHCRECDLRDSCYGCRGHAYQVSGDYLAADPLCWIPKDRAKDRG